jgi:hypothetical protein
LLQLGRHDQLLRHLELLFELQNPCLYLPQRAQRTGIARDTTFLV